MFDPVPKEPRKPSRYRAPLKMIAFSAGGVLLSLGLCAAGGSAPFAGLVGFAISILCLVIGVIWLGVVGMIATSGVDKMS
jgi:hypothetical protein